MPLIALTGGIASGKSTIARRLQEHGAVIVDADQIVRDVQAPGSPVLREIADAFGDDVIDSSGALDRAGLGARVFGDDAALKRLNAIVHPAVRAESARRFREAFETDADAVVVYDVPLLVEARADDPW
ncbi:MAG: dephospho-CoA kinase, partial [Microbacteriaceae bacterium]